MFDCEDVLAYGRIVYCVSSEFLSLFRFCFGSFVARFVITYIYVDIELVVWITLFIDYFFSLDVYTEWCFCFGYVFITRFDWNERLVRLWSGISNK